MKNIVLLSASVLSIGFIVSLFSFLPQTRLEPYYKQIQQRFDKVQQDGTISSWYTFYSQSFNFIAGDTISIRAQAKDGSLSIVISQSLTGNAIEQRDDVTDANINVTIPASGSYTVTINRYRYSPFVVFLAAAEAYIFVKTAITEPRLVPDNRTVITYPYRELLIPGTVLMIAGIGFGIISIAHEKAQGK